MRDLGGYWCSPRITYSDPSGQTAILDGTGRKLKRVGVGMPNNAPSLQSQGSLPYSCTASGLPGRFTNLYATVIKRWHKLLEQAVRTDIFDR